MKEQRFLVMVQAADVNRYATSTTAKVTDGSDHNKFYQATLQDDGSIDIVYGRVGTAGQTKHYYPGERDFRTLIQSKLAKGYTDQTANRVDKNAASLDYAPVPEPDINAIIELMRDKSAQFMRKHYVMQLTDITEMMVKNAQQLLAEAKDYAQAGYGVFSFNEKLSELFCVITRRMAKVSDFLAKTPADYDAILKREEDLLDTLAQQVAAKQILAAPSSNKDTVLSANRLAADDVTYSEEDDLLRNLARRTSQGQSNENRYLRAYRLTNEKTEKAFREYCEKNLFALGHGTELLYHGTKLENLWSIYLTGPKCKIAGVKITGKAYGQGIYFANRSEKSLGYTSRQGSYWAHGTEDTGLLLVYEVAVGESYDPQARTLWRDFDYHDLLQKGDYQSVYSESYRNSEVVVYQDCQCTIRYVIECATNEIPYNMNIFDRLKLSFGDTKTPLSLSVTKNGWKTEVPVAELSSRTRGVLSKFLPDAAASEKIIVGEENGQPVLRSEKGAFNCSSLTDADRKWIVRTAKREFADTERNFTHRIAKEQKEKKNRADYNDR